MLAPTIEEAKAEWDKITDDMMRDYFMWGFSNLAAWRQRVADWAFKYAATVLRKPPSTSTPDPHNFVCESMEGVHCDCHDAFPNGLPCGWCRRSHIGLYW